MYRLVFKFLEKNYLIFLIQQKFPTQRSMLQKHFKNETHTRQYSWSTCATTSCILFNYLQLKKTRQSNPQKHLNKEEKRYTIFILLLLQQTTRLAKQGTPCT